MYATNISTPRARQRSTANANVNLNPATVISAGVISSLVLNETIRPQINEGMPVITKYVAKKNPWLKQKYNPRLQSKLKLNQTSPLFHGLPPDSTGARFGL